MTCHLSLLRCLLLLMLAAGPLQAQTVLLCDMMEVPRQETCCCVDVETAREAESDRECDRPPCGAAPRAEAAACCDSAVEMTYEPEAGHGIAKPADQYAGSDLPTPTCVTYELPEPPEPRSWPSTPSPLPVADADGSSLFLRTERLRI